MRFVIVAIVILFSSQSVIAADITIEMLNKQGSEKMVYSEKVVRVDVGDTVYWKATDKTHNVEFIRLKKGGVPEGLGKKFKFKSKNSKDTEFKFEIPGIYAYWCTPHKSMGMIGFVMVGNDVSNIDKIKKIKFKGSSRKVAKKLFEKLTAE
jgi:pseudoazurin